MIAALTATMPGRVKELRKCIDAISCQIVRPYTHLIRMNYDGCNAMVNWRRLFVEALSDPKIDWLMICSDDDYYYPNHVQAFQDAILEHPEADIIYTWYRAIHQDGHIVQVVNPHNPDVLRNITNYITNPVYHRRVFEELGFGREDTLNADWEYYKQLLQAGRKFVCTGKITFDYIIHGANHHLKTLDYYQP